MIKEVKNLIAFLTILPVGMDPGRLRDAAEFMYLFPLLGAFIGLLAGLFAFPLLLVFQGPVVGILTLGFLLLVTGLHHTDGLLDFGDGLMYQGSPEKKIEVMHDSRTGAGGLALGLVTLLATVSCIGAIGSSVILQVLVVSEVSAKLAMVCEAWLGKSAHTGMNTHFIEAMHSRYGYIRLSVALIVSVIIAIPLLWLTGLLGLAVGILTSSFMVWVSNRHFKGLTGDVFGATNDLARMSSLLAILAASRWV